MRNYYTRLATLAAATSQLLLVHGSRTRNLEDTFIGPGVVECNQGKCDFSVEASLGCSDPCHTRTHEHMYDWAFDEIADVSNAFHLPNSSNDNIIGDPCFHEHAENINSYFPDQYVGIEKGCTAKCTGCTFAPTVIISGPALLDCENGRCSNYTTTTFDCGDEIGAASESYGSFHNVLHGSDTGYSFYGYEGIYTNESIEIPDGCTLDCSGCTIHNGDRRNNLRSNDI